MSSGEPQTYKMQPSEQQNRDMPEVVSLLAKSLEELKRITKQERAGQATRDAAGSAARCECVGRGGEGEQAGGEEDQKAGKSKQAKSNQAKSKTPRTRVGRAVDRLKKSRAGRIVKQLGNSKLGRAVRGAGGRAWEGFKKTRVGASVGRLTSALGKLGSSITGGAASAGGAGGAGAAGAAGGAAGGAGGPAGAVGGAAGALGVAGGVAAAVVGVGIAAYETGKALREFSKETLAANRKMADISASMAAVFAELDAKNLFREMEKGERLSGSARDLAKSEGDFQDNTKEIDVFFQWVKNEAGAVFNDIITDIVKPLNEILKKLNELLGIAQSKDSPATFGAFAQAMAAADARRESDARGAMDRIRGPR